MKYYKVELLIKSSEIKSKDEIEQIVDSAFDDLRDCEEMEVKVSVQRIEYLQEEKISAKERDIRDELMDRALAAGEKEYYPER